MIGGGFAFAPRTGKKPLSRVISSVVPAKGNDRGGTSVVVNGSGFTGAASSDLLFGGQQLTSFTIVSDIKITGVTQALAKGVYDVTMTSAATLSGAWESLDASSSSFGTLVHWFRADKGVVTSGGNVVSIADQSGTGDSNKNYSDNGSSSNRPAFTATNANFNGRPTFGVTGSDAAKHLLNPAYWATPISRPFTRVDAVRIPAGGAAGPIYFELAHDGTSTGAAHLSVDPTTGTATVGSSSGTTTFTIPTGQTLIIFRRYNANTVDVFLNTGLVATLSGGTAGTDQLKSCAMGTYGTQVSQYEIAEGCVYTGAMTSGAGSTMDAFYTYYAADSYATTAVSGGGGGGGGGGGTLSVVRGSNSPGMEMFYGDFAQSTGPVAGSNYPVYTNADIDYYYNAGARILRLTYSWEGMQQNVADTIPAASGNYRTYYTNFKAVVDYATGKGMVVLIEPWQADTSGGAGGCRYRGNVVGAGTYTQAQFAAQWAQLATIFKTNSKVWIGLVNEPNNMSTMTWFAAAQAAITAIRNAGFTNPISVPGNGYSGAEEWTSNYYDTAGTQRSNAYGWLNANGVGSPLTDSANNLLVEVHLYLDEAGGSSDSIVGFNSGTAANAAKDRIKVTVDWARTNGLRVFNAEIGIYAGTSGASTCWSNYITYSNANNDVLFGFCWWAGGMPGWWDDIHGPHFSITPTNSGTFTGDTVNMTMIKANFTP